jgi:DMSO/TMAO reductase YedYZ molybdopterin-dependent catalytic subunit
LSKNQFRTGLSGLRNQRVPLPQKHGFPLRLVAEDHYGARWVKYVDRITAVAD